MDRFDGVTVAISNSALHPDYPYVEMTFCPRCGRPVFAYPVLGYVLEAIDSETEGDTEHECW